MADKEHESAENRAEQERANACWMAYSVAWEKLDGKEHAVLQTDDFKITIFNLQQDGRIGLARQCHTAQGMIRTENLLLYPAEAISSLDSVPVEEIYGETPVDDALERERARTKAKRAMGLDSVPAEKALLLEIVGDLERARIVERGDVSDL